MEETSNIVRLSSPSSLVIIDELGRGTSTNDGVSISSAVMRHLIKDINCLVFFATHYQTLIYESLQYKEVVNYKMAKNSQKKIKGLKR